MNCSMNKRPRSITVISVIFIAFAAITLLVNFLHRLMDPPPNRMPSRIRITP